MKEDIRIVRAGVEHIAAMDSLFFEGDRFHAEGVPQRFVVKGGPARPQVFYEEVLADPAKAFFLALAGELAVGVAFLLVRLRANGLREKVGIVDSLVVAAEWRGKGIGRSLMRQSETWFVEQGVQEIELQVWEFNHGARMLYESLGYAPLRHVLSKKITG